MYIWVFHFPVALIPRLIQVNLFKGHILDLLLQSFTFFIYIWEYSVLKQKLLNSNIHSSLFQIVSFNWLIINFTQFLKVGFLEDLLNLIINKFIEFLWLGLQVFDFLVDLFIVQFPQLVILSHLSHSIFIFLKSIIHLNLWVKSFSSRFLCQSSVSDIYSTISKCFFCFFVKRFS